MMTFFDVKIAASILFFRNIFQPIAPTVGFGSTGRPALGWHLCGPVLGQLSGWVMC